MEFLKKHYEKIILSVVLLVLAAGAFYLTLQVERIKQTIEEQGKVRTATKKEAIKPVDLSTNEMALARLSKPIRVDFSGAHNLANPKVWIEDKNKNLIQEKPGLSRGARGLSITRTIPLYLNVSLEGVAGTGDEIRYQFRVEKQFSKKRQDRGALVITTTLNNKTADGLFVLREIRGPKDAPTEVVIELTEGHEKVAISKDKPLSRVMGYACDLRHDLERKDFTARRVDDTINLDGVAYKIVAITKDEVVISDPTSQKRTVVRSASTL